MAAPHFVALDYVVLVSFMALSAGIGIFVAWHDRRAKVQQALLNGKQATQLASRVFVDDGQLSVFHRYSWTAVGSVPAWFDAMDERHIFDRVHNRRCGGIKAVIWTDVVQMVLMFAGYIMVIASGLKHLGGFGNMWQIASDGGRVIYTNFSTSMYDTYTTWNVLFGYTVIWMVTYCASQTQVQRYSSMKSLERARRLVAPHPCFCVLRFT
ncbi:hypothetical protein HPB52_018821 [Rhipicephalus sanguineus]|uniref:Uncharacterized protein n=1 Tax=Rhipicephalus sanguineus TaxID=34632 RepID=A0A9D4PPI3_RHISA|nr:hypothetical protein HPB52_018821 [Rhipicephalus sanguineus]